MGVNGTGTPILNIKIADSYLDIILFLGTVGAVAGLLVIGLIVLACIYFLPYVIK